jgi:Endonuclease/Exonuclease/phosphatase family
MGLSPGKPVHARHRHGADRADDRSQAPPPRRRRPGRGAGPHLIRALALLALASWSAPAPAETLRIAVFDTELARQGPGLLLRDLVKSPPASDAEAAAAALRKAAPDVVLLLDFDYDAGLAALAAFDELIGQGRPAYPYSFALRPNTGMATGLDLDGDGRRGQPRDAQGFGLFAGQGGMALLSRRPIDRGAVTDLSALLWRDLPGAEPPLTPDGTPVPSAQAMAVQRLSTVGHWDVPIRLAGGNTLHLLAFHASPPVFDGPEDRNGRRARDELRLWTAYLDGTLPWPPPEGAFVILGNANLDPEAGDGDRAAIAAILADPRWQDPLPHRPTAIFDPPTGPLRTDYVLPSAGLRITGAGLVEVPARSGGKVTRHRLVWVDLALE